MPEINVVKPKEKPRYRLLKPFYVNDLYISETQADGTLTEIEWTGVPNEAMEPINEEAKVLMKAYLSTLEGGRTPRVEDLMYKQMLARPKEAAEITIPQAVVGVPQMGNMSPLDSSGEGAKVVSSTAPKAPTKKLMGTLVLEKEGGPSL